MGGYAPRSAEVAAQVFEAIGFDGEPREVALELIRHHEYLFDQILNQTSSEPIPKLCRRWRKKLGPLWRQHFELANALWDGHVLRWIRTNFAAVCQAFDDAEEKLYDVRPEEACPLDGNAIIARYGMPTGPWVRIMKDEIGKWCLRSPNRVEDVEAVLAAADAIFEQHRQSSPVFNTELPFLSLDEEELSTVPDPLGVRPLLIEASHLTVEDVSDWAKGYQRKAVAAVIGAVSMATNGKQTASRCARYFLQLVSALDGITLGEVMKGLATSRRTPGEVAEAISKGREAVAALRLRYEKGRTKDLSLQYARALRDIGHFEEAYQVAKALRERYPQESSIEKLVVNIRRTLSNGDSSAGGMGMASGDCGS